MDNSGQYFIIDSIRREDKNVLLELYTSYFPQVRHYIMSNSGNIFDAEDIFQDALVLIYIKIRKNTLFLSSTFGTYLNGIVHFLWLKELERKRRYFGTSLNTAENLAGDEDFLQDYIKMEKRKLIIDHFNELNEECKKILDLYIKETPIDCITALMGYRSDQYTRNRRTSCKERLIKSIWNNPRFKELQNDAYRQDTKVPRW
jgi:RNA polymerase sigma factor (sigma-70 family)